MNWSRKSSASLAITVDLNNFKEVIKMFSRETMSKVISRTLNTEGTRFKTTIAKSIRKIYNVKSGDIKERVHTKSATYSRLQYIMKVDGHRLNLSRFSPLEKKIKIKSKNGRWGYTRVGVTVKVKRTGGRKLVKGGFSHSGAIFKRAGDDRMPIDTLRTLSIAQMFKKDFIKIGEDNINANLHKTFQSNLNYYLNRI